MQANLLIGQYDDCADTVIITNQATRNEVCRVTSEFGTEEPDLYSFIAMKKVIQSLNTMPSVMRTMERLVEKVERIQAITRTGGTVKREDLIELTNIGSDGREIIEIGKMFDAVTNAGYSILRSEFGGFYYENQFSVDGEASEDFVTIEEAFRAAYLHVTSRPALSLLP